MTPRNEVVNQEQPNLLIIMSDEHGPMFSGTYGHPLVKTPHMDRLASNGVLFQNAYCNSPLCMPSRMSFMTGRYIHHIGAWDNDSPMPSDTVTWAHMLRVCRLRRRPLRQTALRRTGQAVRLSHPTGARFAR